MNSDLVSAHIFLYYEATSKYVLDAVSKFYNGPIYLSLVENNCSNDVILHYAKQNFDQIFLIYVDDHGTDQYGFYTSFQYDTQSNPWIFYCHDKHINKINWLKDLIEIYNNFDHQLLLENNNGIISSLKHKHKAFTYEELLAITKNIGHRYRKGRVQSMHTVVWANELVRILLEKYNLYNKDAQYPYFTAGNIFLIRRDIVKYAHGCTYDEFFNKNAYRSDGDVGHGLERFYYYVSQCLGYNNLFI